MPERLVEESRWRDGSSTIHVVTNVRSGTVDKRPDQCWRARSESISTGVEPEIYERKAAGVAL